MSSSGSARAALKKFDGNLEHAANWLFSNPDAPLDGGDGPAAAAPRPERRLGEPVAREFDFHPFHPFHSIHKGLNPSALLCLDFCAAGSPAKYQLRAFVTHIGQSTSSGHYVAHIRIGDRWIHFNDAKVAVAEKPPIGSGYLYFFERVC